MSLIIAPSLVQNPDKNSYSSSFVYDFSDDSPELITYNGLTMLGSQYQFDAINFQGVINIPIFRSLSISAVFAPPMDEAKPDGNLIIVNQFNSQQIILAPSLLFNPARPTNAAYIVTASIPFLSGLPTKLSFIKQSMDTVANPVMEGRISVTFSTELLPAWASQGYAGTNTTYV